MKIICLIDALGAGGAERQMSGLSTMLYERGYSVEVWYFEDKHFFATPISQAGVKVRYFNYKNKIQLLCTLSKEIKKQAPDIVISYLQTASQIAALIKLFVGHFKLIVSERNTNKTKGIRDIIRFNLFRVADYIVPNSYSQTAFINKHFRFLTPKVRTIINFVDTQRFAYKPKNKGSNIIVVGTVWPPKNTLGFIEALNILNNKGISFHVKWYGKTTDAESYVQECECLIRKYNLEDKVQLLEKIPNIELEYFKATIFCLPSIYEGTPNVLCEAMSTGLPVLCSDVCDNSKYVTNGENGYLFNPSDPTDIANVLSKMLSHDSDKFALISKNNRNKAISLFDSDAFINSYIKLF